MSAAEHPRARPHGAEPDHGRRRGAVLAEHRSEERHLGDRHHGHAGHHGPSHRIRPGADVRFLMVALGLIASFMVGEVAAAMASGSLALFADAGHMLTDAGALAAGVWAARLAARPATGRWTFGLERAEILSATGNGVLLVVVALVITVEAVRRLIAPPSVEGTVVLVVALSGALVNVAATMALARADRRSLNVQGAFAHVVTDLFAFLGTAAAGLVIVSTGWDRADAVASLVVAGLMLLAGRDLLTRAGRILLQAAPEGLSLDEVRAHLSGVDHVVGVHDLHAWTVTSGRPTLSAHVVVEDRCFASGHAPQILDTLQRCLGRHFDVEHATFQLEPPGHADHEQSRHR